MNTHLLTTLYVGSINVQLSRYSLANSDSVGFFKKMGQISFFLHDKYSINTINEKSVDGVLGT